MEGVQSVSFDEGVSGQFLTIKIRIKTKEGKVLENLNYFNCLTFQKYRAISK